MEEHLEKRKYCGNDETVEGHKRVNAAIQNSSQVPTIKATMECPNSKVGQVIGKHGVVLQAISAKSGCKITLDTTQSDPRKVFLSGPPDGLGIAMMLITQVIAEGPSFLTPYNDIPEKNSSPARELSGPSDSDEFLCPHESVATLIGSNGSTISEIMRKAGCKIYILQDGVPSGMDRKVQFTGSPDSVAHAKEMVRKIISGSSHMSTPRLAAPQGNNTNNNFNNNSLQEVEETLIQPQKVGGVIGSKGSTIGEIMRLSGGCQVSINQNFPPGEMHRVVYKGTKAQIQAAISYVTLVIDQGPNALTNLKGPLPPTPVATPVLSTPPSAYGAEPVNMNPVMLVPANMPINMQSMGGGAGGTSIVQKLPLTQMQLSRMTGEVLQYLEARHHVRIVVHPLESPGGPQDFISELMVTGVSLCASACVQDIMSIVSGAGAVVTGSDPMMGTHQGQAAYQPAAMSAVQHAMIVPPPSIPFDNRQLGSDHGALTFGMANMHLPGALHYQQQLVPQQYAYQPQQPMMQQMQQYPSHLYQQNLQPQQQLQYHQQPHHQQQQQQYQHQYQPQLQQQQQHIPQQFQQLYQYAQPMSPQSQMSQMITEGVMPTNPSLSGTASVSGTSNRISGNSAPNNNNNNTVKPLLSAASPAGGQILISHPQARVNYVLGADGSAGHLEATTSLPQGLEQQVAVVNNRFIHIFTNNQFSVVNLMMQKSGTVISLAPNSRDNNLATNIVLVGLPAGVKIASQMIQEALVSGTATIERMPNIPRFDMVNASVGGGGGGVAAGMYTVMGGQGQGQGPESYHSAPMAARQVQCSAVPFNPNNVSHGVGHQ